MKPIELPEFLYKFVTWEKDFHKDILRKQIVFFPSAGKFNDPFDSTVPLKYELGSDEQLLDLYKEHIRREKPGLNSNQVSNFANVFFREKNPKDPFSVKHFRDYQQNLAKTKFGIFVLTTEHKNLLMWSHYSNSHTGICIRFNSKQFRKFIEKDCIENKNIIMWDKITYNKDYPSLNPFELDDIEIVLKPLTVKSSDWKYENEYRFILFDSPNTPLKLPEGIIDQVILGCKTSSTDKSEIIKIASENNISIMESKINENEFSLDIQEITNV